MPDTDPTVRLATADCGAENSGQLEASETNALIALHSFCSQSTPASREIAMRAVETFVDTMRDAGCPPEHVVITIKAIARRAGALG